jgi:SEC-C motif domain protein
LVTTPTTRCPCGSGDTYGACCGPLHAGDSTASTASALMRSRYTAFAEGAADYLLATWHPSTRPDRVAVDERMTWRRLEIVDSVDGGPFDTSGVVEFRAHYRIGGARGVLHERSHFVHEDGRWLYVRGEVGDR